MTTYLPFEIKAGCRCEDFILPNRMAKVVHVSCSITTEQAVFDHILKCFMNCCIVGINFNDLTTLTTIKKICNVVLKKGITIDILSASKVKRVQGIVDKLKKKYDLECEMDLSKKSGSNLLKRKLSEEDCLTLQVLADLKLRKEFLLKYLIQLNSIEDGQQEHVNNNVENPFACISKIKNYNNNIDIRKFFTCGVDDAFHQVQQFINSIIHFNGYSVLVTSLDIFFHNHKYQDDCTHSLPKIFKVATAKVSRKTNTDKSFMEISIFAGYYELLIVGVYFHKNGSTIPFLGSSVDQFTLVEEETQIINVPAIASNYVATTRLLSQYMKCHSHHFWGIHCASSYSKGVYPISPIEYMNHACKKISRKTNNHHFFSSMLHLITSPKAIKDDHMEDLWSVFILLLFYQKLMEGATTATNFIEMSAALNTTSIDGPLISIIHILGEIQAKTPCFFLFLHDETKARRIALQLKKSMNKTIRDQHAAIVKKRYKDL